MGGEPRGAYGFRLIPPPHEEELPDLAPQAADATEVALEWRHATALVKRMQLDQDVLCVAERGTSSLEVRREPASIVAEFVEPATPETVVHPLLTMPLSVLARWRGDLTLHAGSFFAGGKAWAVIGSREAGKSTTLAMIAECGFALLADDLLVLDEGVVRAGPACIDLRPEAAERIPGTRFLGKVGTRERCRLNTLHGPARADLGGFLVLEWSDGDSVEVEPVPTAEALQTIYQQEYIGLLGPGDPQKILALLGTPMWRVRRPRDWDLSEEAVGRILELSAG